MTHESERTFHLRVLAYLIDKYGRENVKSEKFLRDTYTFCDVWVDDGFVKLAIEIENDAPSVREGVGQALEYAGNETNAHPMVVVPEGHTHDERVAALRKQGVVVKELDV